MLLYKAIMELLNRLVFQSILRQGSMASLDLTFLFGFSDLKENI